MEDKTRQDKTRQDKTTVNSNIDVSSNNTKHSKKKTNKNKTNNIFLQDNKNPDRIIAINPFGKHGVYQYRQQANGNIYPEYKYFDSKTSFKNGNIRVTPTSKNSKAKSFNFYGKSNKQVKDKASGDTFTVLDNNDLTTNDDDTSAANASNTDNIPIDQRDYMKHVSRNNIQFKDDDTYMDQVKKVVSADLSDPSDSSSSNSKEATFSGIVHLKNGDFIDVNRRVYYGYHFNDFDVKNFTPYKYMYTESHNPNDIMYYRNNNQTNVTDWDKSWVYDWSDRAVNAPATKF
ncbi:hypothetical protein [Companilactobacillus mishanensis]|uniref:hypothetical protein n=1 Tax=Companilactobacillus mishanensis TaxID=2486008 RepID=UPI0012D6DB51|nr:hypothetical protein [Companilactobacillus mishanensis]MQS89829.1 hypothetical protein [Companilactobacillus mishanensis]